MPCKIISWDIMKLSCCVRQYLRYHGNRVFHCLLTALFLVVSKMGILGQTSNFQNCIKKTNKIPEYAREFKNEYLFIKGINKTCGEFLKRLDSEGKVFNTPKAYNLTLYIRRFLKAQDLDYLKDISEFYFKIHDTNNIEYLEEQLDNFSDVYCDSDSFEFDEERYNNNVEKDYPGFKDLFEFFNKLTDKIKTEEYSFSDFCKDICNLSSDSDSDSDGIVSDDVMGILSGYEDSESDSDSD